MQNLFLTFKCFVDVRLNVLASLLVVQLHDVTSVVRHVLRRASILSNNDFRISVRFGDVR